MIEIDKQQAGWERIVPADCEAEILFKGFGNYVDGPVWDVSDGSLLFTESWVNKTPGKIWKWYPDGRTEVVLSPSKGLGATLDNDGRLVVAGWGSRKIWRREHDGSVTDLATHLGIRRINTPNDVVVHSSGAIYWTDPATALYGNGRGTDQTDDLQRHLDFEGVLRLWPASSFVEAVATDFALPNGITFSHDEKRLYVNDTVRRHIRVFDVLGDGSLTNSRVFYEAEADFPGTFDGMKVDIDGNLYCTAPGGIHILTPDGTLLCRIRFPAPVGTVAWGGPDWRSMFVTMKDTMCRIELKIPGVPVGKK